MGDEPRHGRAAGDALWASKGAKRMTYRLTPLSGDDRKPVIDIFNHYVENDFSAYPEERVPYEFFDGFLKMVEGYAGVVAKDEDGDVVGFGMLRAHNALPTFSRTAEVMYFIRPEDTRKGVGRQMLEYLSGEAARLGVATILASISSMNHASIRFHGQNGFVECGRFREVGMKMGRLFDVVWMQKALR
jgi:phosphinothricin acetyltransferase